MSLKDRILDGISETVEKYFPKRNKIKSVEIKPDPEDLPDVGRVKMGRGGRNSHIVYKKR